jgi:hypothetical protein
MRIGYSSNRMLECRRINLVFAGYESFVVLLEVFHVYITILYYILRVLCLSNNTTFCFSCDWTCWQCHHVLFWFCLPVCGAANFLCGVMTFILFKYCRELYFFELIISGNNMSGGLMIYIIVALLNYALHFSYIIFSMCFFVNLVKMLALKVHPRILKRHSF